MTPIRKSTGIRLDDDLIEGLQIVWERDGVNPSEQVRRAVRAWLEAKGVIAPKAPKAERKQAATRKRS
jgi:metal-responsive CopG/Arc/MetJ family transcriptional regulator